MKAQSKLSFDILDSDLEDCEKALSRFLSSSRKWRKLRSEVPVSYDPVSNTPVFWIEGIKFQNFKEEDLTILCLLSYFEEDPNLSSLLKLELIEKLERTKGLEDLALLPQYGLKAIKNNFRFNRRYFRSLFSKEMLRKFESHFSYKILKPKTSKPKRPVRHKGYRDHGTLPSISSTALRKGISEELSLKLLQVQIEEYRENIQYWLSLHRSYLDQKGAPLAEQKIERRILYVDGKARKKQRITFKSSEEEREYRETDHYPGKEDCESGKRTSESEEIGIYLRVESSKEDQK